MTPTPRAHKITVTSKGAAPFTYTDTIDAGQPGNPSTDHHVNHDDTISWISPSGAITVTFQPCCNPTDHLGPITAPKNTPTTPVKLIGHHPEPAGTPYKYTATINGVSDDPQIIFDDSGTLVGDLRTLSTAAQTTFQGVLTDLKNNVGLKRDPDGVFFPGGIDNIQVEVTALGITANITVSGPAATVLSGPRTAKK